jgi:hypothetical protein
VQLDLPLRRPRRTVDQLTLHHGRTSLLDDRLSTATCTVQLAAHVSHREATAFDQTWWQAREVASVEADWPCVETYLDTRIAGIETSPGRRRRYLEKEGLVHAATSMGWLDPGAGS